MFRLFPQAFNNVKLRTKLIVSFVAVVFLPVLIVGIFLTRELRAMTLDNAIDQTYTNVQRVKARTAELINVLYDSAYRIANNEKLESVTNRRYGSTYEVVKAYREFTDFNEERRLYGEIDNIRLYVENGTLLNNWEFIQPTEEIQQADWYMNAFKYFGNTVNWYYLKDERDNRDYLSLVRKVAFPDYASSGVLVMNVNMTMLTSILRQESFETMIVDESGTIVAANRSGLAGRTLSDIDLDPKIMTGKGNMFETDVEGVASRVFVEPFVPESSANALRIISVFSIDNIVKDANRINKLALTVITASLFIAIVLVFGVSTILSKRMLRLSKHITKVATGNLDISMDIDGKDEIGQLSRQFNAMVSSINGLVAEVQETNKQKNLLESKQSEIKLKMMASQMNPHFLYNALESIRMKAHLKGEKDIAQVVRLLGKLMRKNLEVGQGRTSLADEIDIVRCYLDIQKFRYEDRLTYGLHVDPSLTRMPIPPLIIQPLVENAVIHGLEDKLDSGKVEVRVARAGGVMAVEVSDDGVGISPDKLSELKRKISDTEDSENHRIGLHNVHMRLILSYGPEHGLRFDSEPGVGTRISFTIPIKEDLYV